MVRRWMQRSTATALIFGAAFVHTITVYTPEDLLIGILSVLMASAGGALAARL